MLISAAPLVKPSFPSGCSLAFSATGYQFTAPTVAWSGRRHYMYPGLGSDNTLWQTAPFNTLVADLLAQGDQLVYVPIPLPTVACYFQNGGWQYREQFVAQLNAIMNSVEAANGPARINLAGGISFGGLHAMIAAASSGRIGAWWANVPVTFIDALSQYASVGPVQRFNTTFEVLSLKNTTGWMSYGTQDAETNYLLTQALGAQLGRGVTVKSYDQPHETTLQNVNDIMSWIGTTFE